MFATREFLLHARLDAEMLKAWIGSAGSSRG
jgi:hypothetical protein